MSVTIYHNPRCSKSRQTLALLQERGIEPTIIEYLATPPSTATLKQLIDMLKIHPSGLLRKNEADYKEHGKGKDLSDAELIKLMVTYPKLIERPIVVNGTKAALGRPPENVLEIL